MDFDLYCRQTVTAMLKLRGWTNATATPEVRDDVFNTISRHDRVYSASLANGNTPAATASQVQNLEWSL